MKVRSNNLEIKQKKGANMLLNESGQAMLEFAVSLFFLGGLTMGIIDFGNILNDYSALTEAAHQGARFGSGNLHLKDIGDSTTNDPVSRLTNDQAGCSTSITTKTGQGPATDGAHRDLQNRVSQVLNLSKTQLNKDSLCVTSQLENTAGDENIIVSVQVAYKSMLFGELPITVQAKAPFLHN